MLPWLMCSFTIVYYTVWMCSLFTTLFGCIHYSQHYLDVFIVQNTVWMCPLFRTLFGCVHCSYTIWMCSLLMALFQCVHCTILMCSLLTTLFRCVHSLQHYSDCVCCSRRSHLYIILLLAVYLSIVVLDSSMF